MPSLLYYEHKHYFEKKQTNKGEIIITTSLCICYLLYSRQNPLVWRYKEKSILAKYFTYLHFQLDALAL